MISKLYLNVTQFYMKSLEIITHKDSVDSCKMPHVTLISILTHFSLNLFVLQIS